MGLLRIGNKNVWSRSPLSHYEFICGVRVTMVTHLSYEESGKKLGYENPPRMPEKMPHPHKDSEGSNFSELMLTKVVM